jgi:uncharacterized surface protein with fasciclin (FAS1) repeats
MDNHSTASPDRHRNRRGPIKHHQEDKMKKIAIFAICASALFAPALQAGGGCGGSWHADKADIVETAVKAGSFNTLAAALQAAGLVDALKGEGPFTVFAPNDEAFAKLPAGTVEKLLEPENRDQLIAILTYHVVSGEVKAKAARKLDRAETLNGQFLAIDANRRGVRINEANVVQADITASNGVIHVIDSVLIPGHGERAAMAPEARSDLASLR